MKLALAIAIAFTGSSHGYAVTQGQALYATNDAGFHWQLVARRVWAPPVGGIYAKQVGRGAYQVVRDGKRLGVIRDAKGDVPQFDVVDAQHLFATLGEGAAAGSSGQALYASADGGRTWRFVSRADVGGTHRHALPFSCDKSGVGFATPSRGFATAYCAGGPPFLYRTDDGGSTWRKLTLPGLAQCACGTHSARFFDEGRGAFALDGFVGNGSRGPIVRLYWTRDGGLHWYATQPPAGRLAAPSVQIPNAHTAWFLGTAPHHLRPDPRFVFRTTDSGRTWQRHPLPFHASIVQLDAVNETTAFALTPQALYRTEDGGRTWQLPAAQTDLLHAYDLLHASGFRVGLTGTVSMSSLRIPGVRMPRPHGKTVELIPNGGPIGSPAILKSHPHYRVPDFVGRSPATAVAWADRHAMFWSIPKLPALPPSHAPHLLDAYRVVAQQPAAGRVLGQGVRVGRGFRVTFLVLSVARR